LLGIALFVTAVTTHSLVVWPKISGKRQLAESGAIATADI
jgi:hypothetical protein